MQPTPTNANQRQPTSTNANQRQPTPTNVILPPTNAVLPPTNAILPPTNAVHITGGGITQVTTWERKKRDGGAADDSGAPMAAAQVLPDQEIKHLVDRHIIPAFR